MSAAFARGTLTANEIARMLADRIEQLAPELLPGGHREGHEWRCGSIRGEPGNSLGVHLRGNKAGIWRDFADTNVGGDALALAMAVLWLPATEAMDWACRWLGISAGPAPAPKRRPPPPATSKPKAGPDNTEDDDKQQRALDIWRAASACISDTPADAYLRSRNLDPARLQSLLGHGLWPATLRYSERAHLDPDRECRALIVAVHGACSGLVRAIHRILLTPDGASVRDQRGRRIKLALGPVAGNAARFDCVSDPEWRWGIAEGVETALAATCLTGIPTWSAISAGNMRNIVPPAWAQHVTVFADRDLAGESAAADALEWFRSISYIKSARILASLREGEDVADMIGGNNG